jgi:hypothetical protein
MGINMEAVVYIIIFVASICFGMIMHDFIIRLSLYKNKTYTLTNNKKIAYIKDECSECEIGSIPRKLNKTKKSIEE